MKLLSTIAILLLLAACGNGSSVSGAGLQAGNNGDSTLNQISVCKNPRSQVCTREYAPVCGKLNNNALKTYDNACTACADESVEEFYPAACAAPVMKACVGPRPEVCTLDYTPVCGQKADGQTLTFGNACMACGESSVIGYSAGACG